MRKIKVLLIDDSALVRKVLRKSLPKDEEIEVIGEAPNPIIGRDLIVKLKPDVVLLDIEMPKMDGITFLRKLMKYKPMPVIIVSSLAQKGAKIAVQATELGAVDVVAKPGRAYSIGTMAEQLAEKIKAAARVNMRRFLRELKQKSKTEVTIKNKAILETTKKIIAIGASTGGTRAIQEVLVGLPVNMPPIVIVQHMPPNFTKAFAQRLNELCKITVKEAKDGDSVISGQALIAPGDRHMLLKRSGARYYVQLKDGPLFYHQKPSVEVLFKSVAEYAGSNALGVILTGMGKDGAKGLLKMKNSGAFTIGQDKKSSTVYGMPRQAYEIGAVSKQVPLDKIGQELIDQL